MKNLSLLPLFSAALLLGSCVPEFENPLPSERVEADAALLGDWRSDPDAGGDQSRAAFFARTNGWYDIVFLTGLNRRAGTDGLDCSLYEGFSTRVGDRAFLCFRLRERDFKERRDAPEHFRFLIAGYETGPNSLEVSILSESKVRDLIKGGVLQGQAGQSTTGGPVVVVSSPAALRDALLKTPGEDLFGEPLKFKRLR